VCARTIGGFAAWFAGFPDRAGVLNAEGIGLGRTLGDPFSYTMALSFGSSVAMMRREPEIVEERCTAMQRLLDDHQLGLGQRTCRQSSVRAASSRSPAGRAHIRTGQCSIFLFTLSRCLAYKTHEILLVSGVRIVGGRGGFLFPREEPTRVAGIVSTLGFFSRISLSSGISSNSTKLGNGYHYSNADRDDILRPRLHALF
jgi:hypothetical protein